LKEVQTMLTAKWNVECRMFNTQIEQLNKKIFTLETIMKSKDKLIQRWVILNIKSVKLIMN
jgi:hypothetical protein